MKHIGGVDEEGEIQGPWRHTGVQGLWYMMGNLALCRFHSNHVALRMFFFYPFSFTLEKCLFYFILEIKAMEEGVYGTRYERGQ